MPKQNNKEEPNIIEEPNIHISPRAIGTIIIDWQKKNRTLTCMVISDKHYSDNRLDLDEEDMKSFGDKFQALLTKYVKRKKYRPKRLRDVLEKLQGLGHRSFRRIIPPTSRSVIKGWPSGAVLNIRTNESYIPWELLYDGDGFLGMKFILCRLPLTDKRSEIPQTEEPDCILHVKQEGLRPPISSTEIFKEHSLEVCEPEPVDIDTIRKIATRAVILDFLCHCEINGSPVPCLRFGPNTDQELQSTQVETFSLCKAPLVFANACRSGKANLLLAELMDFANEFYKAGAQAYIGTIGNVPAIFAPYFSQSFYSYLKRVPAFKALHKTKTKYYRLYRYKLIEAGILEKSEDDGNDTGELDIKDYIPNPFWLYYSYYGNPVLEDEAYTRRSRCRR